MWAWSSVKGLAWRRGLGVAGCFTVIKATSSEGGGAEELVELKRESRQEKPADLGILSVWVMEKPWVWAARQTSAGNSRS